MQAILLVPFMHAARIAAMRRGWALVIGIALTALLAWLAMESAATRRQRARTEPGTHAALRAEETLARLEEPAAATQSDAKRSELEHEPSASVAAARPAASRAALVVRVLDPLGAPVEGFDVAVSSSEVESEELAYAERRATTDGDGRARFDPVSWELRLVVALRGQDLYERFSRVRAGELVADATPGSEPLVVADGETREVVVRLGTRVRLRGVVLEEGVGPVPLVGVFAIPHPPEGNASDSVSSREDGTFELELVSFVALDAVDVVAERRPVGSMFQPKPATHRAVERVSLVGLPTGEVSVRLVLAPTLALAGRVVEADGRAAEGQLRARRRTEGPGSRLDAVTSVVKGEFRVKGLFEGEYELELRANPRRGEGVPLGVFAAGTEDLRLALPPEKKTLVTFEVSTAAGLAAPPSVLLAHLREPLRPIEATLAREVVLDAPLGWPENAIASLSSGGGNFRSSAGDVTHSLGTHETNPVVLELSPGPFCLAARGTDALGRTLFPAGTGFVRLEEGEYRVRLELVPATSLAGRVEGVLPQEELHVALALPDGRLVPLDGGRGWMRATNPLDARGAFRFELAPSGTFELCVGRGAELLDGRAQLRQLVTLRAGEPAEVALDLGAR